MSYGLQITSSLGRLQIDQDSKMPRLIQSGYIAAANYLPSGYYGASLHLPSSAPSSSEPPLVLVKPTQADKYVGAFRISPPNNIPPPSPNGAFDLLGQCPFYYAVFSSLGAPLEDTDNFGFIVNTASGSVAYSSKHQHPRIRALFYRAAQSIGFPASYSLAGFDSMPWILANPLLQTDKGAWDFSGSVACIMAKINSTYTTITFEMMEVAINRVFPNLVDKADYNPYQNLPAWFGVADYA